MCFARVQDSPRFVKLAAEDSGASPLRPQDLSLWADWLRCWAVITRPALVRTRVSARVPSLDCPILCTSVESITDCRLSVNYCHRKTAGAMSNAFWYLQLMMAKLSGGSPPLFLSQIFHSSGHIS